MATTEVAPVIDAELESLVPPEIQSQALVLQNAVSLQSIPIGDTILYQRVNRAGLDAAGNIKSITAVFEQITADRYAHWQRATKLRAKMLLPFEEVKIKASRLVGSYDQEAERLRLAEEARLQREENERAQREQEEQRLLAEAEAKRIADEQAIADAIALDAAGDTKGAEAVLNHPAPVATYVPEIAPTPIIVQKSTPKVIGKATVTTWNWRVKKSPKCKAVGIHDTNTCSVCLEDVDRQYLVLNTALIGQLVRANREKTAITGIEVFPAAAARFKG